MRIPNSISNIIAMYQEVLRNRQKEQLNFFSEIRPEQFPWFYDFVTNRGIDCGGILFPTEDNVEIARKALWDNELFEYLRRCAINIDKGYKNNPWDNAVYFVITHLIQEYFRVAFYEKYKECRPVGLPNAVDENEIEKIKDIWTKYGVAIHGEV